MDLSEPDDRPTPDDFDAYIPWACHQLLIPGTIIITRIVQNDYVSSYHGGDKKPKSKLKSRAVLSSDLAKEDKTIQALQPIAQDLSFINPIFIRTTYDLFENLVQIKFDKCNSVPCGIFKLLALIMQFHTHCINFTINKGINNNSLIDITKIISTSNVTDLCLDGTFIKNAHYSILLKQKNNLRHLSLCRCKISDEEVKKIAETLTYPEPSSNSLVILNLSSNRITDIGAKFIADALRTNRQLCYLNISDNSITDDGAISIITILGEFPISKDEVLASKKRATDYMRKRSELVSQFYAELKCGDAWSLKPVRKKNKPLPNVKLKKGEKDTQSKSNLAGESNSLDEFLYEKAKTMADEVLGEFYDPFSETFTKDYQIFSVGNNKLSYLNVAYNNISAISLKTLLNVITYQKSGENKCKGLVNVNLDGNLLPKTCIELVKLNDILQSTMAISMMQLGSSKKRQLPKNTK